MKFAKKLTALAVSSLMMFSVAGITASAATVTRDGLNVSLTTDKTEYKKDEAITATLTVENTGGASVKDVKLENIVPEGYELAKDYSLTKSVDELKSNDKAELKVVYNAKTGGNVTPSDNPTPPNNTPSNNKTVTTANTTTTASSASVETAKTGDNDKALYISVFVLIIAFALIVICLRNKKGKQLLSVFLCLTLAGSILPMTNISASAKTLSSQIDIKENIKADGQILALASKVSYNKTVSDTNILTVDFDGMLYDDESDTYYQPDEMTKLTGTLEDDSDIKRANCTVKDVNGKVLLDKDFKPEKQWTVDDFALIVGENTVTVSVEYTDGTKDEKIVKINNINEKNMDPLNVDKNDDDKDGVLNFIEELYHTDPKNEDSDKDGLTDYYEMAILGTDPNKPDTDGNSVSDADEDADKDGLTNSDEIKKYNTDPTCIDSDGDTISDSDEINKYKTDPNEADTDKDGKDDNWEVENGYDPIVPNTDFPEEKEETGKTPDGIQVNSNGYVEVTVAEDNYFLNYNTPGYIGVEPVHVEIEDGKTATLTFDYDPSVLPDGEQPKLYRFNEDTQKLEEVPSIVTEDGKVQATVNTNGDYVLLNHRKVEDVWNNDIYTSKTTDSDGEINIVFVVDRSYSMNSNDPEELRKKAIKKFLERLRPGKDKAALIQFTAIAETVIPLTQITNDNKLFTEALDAMENSDGGGCGGSDQNAGTNGAAGLRYALNEIMETDAPNKYIVFLTDGEDDGSEGREFFNTYDDVISDAKGKSIKIYTVGLIGSGGVDIELLKRIATETDGKYYLATAGADIEVEINPEEGVFPLEDIYDEIAQEVDKESDYNKDGITDYITRLICDKKLTTSTGRSDFFKGKSYDEVQKSGSDLDGDGLKNGEELEIKADGDKLYIKFNSDPTEPDSDNDGLNDFVETKTLKTSPLKFNSAVDKPDVDWLTDNNNFMSGAYLNLYNSSSFEKGSVSIGNSFFGTVADQTVLYQIVLCNYFEALDSELLEKRGLDIYNEMNMQAYFALVDQIIEKLKHGIATKIAENDDEIKGILDTLGNLKSINDKTKLEAIKKSTNAIRNFVITNELVKANQETERLRTLLKSIPAGDDEFYNRVLSNLYDDLIQNSVRIDKLNFRMKEKPFKENPFELSGVGVAFDVLSFINFGLTVAEIKSEEAKQYCSLLANMELLCGNIYILKSIIATSDNEYLVKAAKNLQKYATEIMNNDLSLMQIKKDYENFSNQAIGMEALHTILGSELAQYAVSCIPYVGQVLAAVMVAVEAVRDIGNIFFHMDSLSKAAAYTVASAQTSDILSKHYLNHLNGGYATDGDGKLSKWVAYSDFSADIYTYLLNIAVIRQCSENYMKSNKGDKDSDGNELDYYFNQPQEVRDYCETNMHYCQEMMNKYTGKLLYYFSKVANSN